MEEPAGLSAAKWLVDRGALVIPAYISKKTADKMPLLKDWANNGTKDYDVLTQWWRERPWAWPGYLGGRGSFLCLDGDGPEAVSWLREFVTVNKWNGEGALITKTPGRTEGIHLVWRWPDWLADVHKIEVRREGWRGAIELRGKGCWTMAPGCPRPDGEYTVLAAPDVLDEFPKELWESFIVEGDQTIAGNSSGDLRELSVRDAFDGRIFTDGRKNAVAGLAWSVMLRGMEEDECLELCLQFAAQCCEPPLEEAIVHRKVDYTAQRIEKMRARQLAEMTNWNASINKLFG